MKQRKITIIIDATFGSDFQEEVATKSLKAFIQAWAKMYQETHKKNLIIWDYHEEK